MLSGEITPEYLGVGYIIGPRIAGVLVAGGVLAWLGLIPLIAVLTPPDAIAAQLVKLGYLPSLLSAGGPGGWDPADARFREHGSRRLPRLRPPDRRRGGRGGRLHHPAQDAPHHRLVVQGERRARCAGATPVATRRRAPSAICPSPFVFVGAAVLVLVMAALPFVPGAGIGSKLLLGLLIVVFGFFFVTVASRIVGLIGSSSNPVSGMTIATLMATCLVFVGLGWTGDVYQPMALCVGGDGLHRGRERGSDVAGPQDRVPGRRDAARAADRPAHRRRRPPRWSSGSPSRVLDTHGAAPT